MTFHVLLLATSLAAAATPNAAPTPQPLALSEAARADLAAIYAEKTSRTPAQKKLDTALVQRVRNFVVPSSRRAGAPRLEWTYDTDASGRVLVDIKGLPPLDEIERLGGEVVSSFPQYQATRAWLPFESLEPLAELDEVRSIRRAEKPYVNKIDTSEGDAAHGANLARSQFAVDGTEIKIGVISDSVEKLASLQASGDLPAVTVLPGQGGAGNSEGTAMLEIVHDLAPGAQLYFATANGGQANFANNILALAAAGCRVIVDDVGYFSEGVFQDDVVAQAVNTATAAGVVYFSSAGNSGNLSSSQSGAWEGDYLPGAAITFPGHLALPALLTTLDRESWRTKSQRNPAQDRLS